MLYPQTNRWRQVQDLSGIWEIRFDQEDRGGVMGWQHGFTDGQPIAVPASWNDQLLEGRDYLGPAWYQTSFTLPWGWDEHRVYMRFGSANYFAQVWLNGHLLGAHEGGHLPFEFDLTGHLHSEENLLVVRVEGWLAPDRVPPGNRPEQGDSFWTSYPNTCFDFFPFCGLHRPVLLYAVPQVAIHDVTVTTELAGNQGRIAVEIEHSSTQTPLVARLTLQGHGIEMVVDVPGNGKIAAGTLEVAEVAVWSPETPHLYNLTVELVQGEEILDRYTLAIGVRTISVVGHQLLLNGQPLLLRGFGKHEDFPITGRGLVPAVIIKDYELMRWVGANSLRTTHYPYAEQMMDLADRLGFLVIDEIPAVGLFFAEEGLQRRLDLCRQYTTELITRDKNHPSVIMWSLANEPRMEHAPVAQPFFRELYELAKDLDSTRPVTLVSDLGQDEEIWSLYDVICLNRYVGWYTNPAQLDIACTKLAAELDSFHARYQKPIILAEFGADALAGNHALGSELFSEEYQAEFLTRYIELLQQKEYIAGQHIWCFADFKTPQSMRRVGGFNLKGIFTRDRQPKLAAHQLRKLWQETTKSEKS
jgi:beta-glucuronidase